MYLGTCSSIQALEHREPQPHPVYGDGITLEPTSRARRHDSILIIDFIFSRDVRLRGILLRITHNGYNPRQPLEPVTGACGNAHR